MTAVSTISPASAGEVQFDGQVVGAVVPTSVRLTATSLELDEEMSVEDWQQAVEGLATVERGSSWWLGDAIVQGGRRYGETYAKAIVTTSYSQGHLQNLASFARRIPAANRRSDLPHSTHREVAPLTADQQPEWLWRAAENQWSARELHDALRKSGTTNGRQRPGASPAPLERGGNCPKCGQPW